MWFSNEQELKTEKVQASVSEKQMQHLRFNKKCDIFLTDLSDILKNYYDYLVPYIYSDIKIHNWIGFIKWY